MVAVPILAGALLRVVNGVLVDRIGPKRTGLIGQLVVLAGLLAAWLHGIGSYSEVLMLGIVLGVAGSAFAVALPLASRWYPPEQQGTALGIAGAGNSGTVFAALFAPSLAAAFGWINVIGLAAIPVTIALAVYLVAAKDSPNKPPAKSWGEYLAVLRNGDAWWFMFFYSVTFGGFSGLTSSLAIYFNSQYGLPPITAGYLTAACVFAGSLVRPVRRHRRGQRRRDSDVVDPVSDRCRRPDRRKLRSAAGVDGARRLYHRHAGIGHGQRCGVPTRAAAIP